MSCTKWILLHPKKGTYSLMENQGESEAVERAKDQAKRREKDTVILCKFEPVYKVNVTYDEKYYGVES